MGHLASLLQGCKYPVTWRTLSKAFYETDKYLPYKTAAGVLNLLYHKSLGVELFSKTRFSPMTYPGQTSYTLQTLHVRLGQTDNPKARTSMPSMIYPKPAPDNGASQISQQGCPGQC